MDGVADSPEFSVAIQVNLIRLEKWPGKILIKFNKGSEENLFS